MKPSSTSLAWAAIVAVALVPRLAPLLAGKPYVAYVDEGNLLHPVATALRAGGWDPGTYDYPQLPVTAAAATARALAPLHERQVGRPLVADLRAPGEPHDIVAPFTLLLAGRLASLLAGIGVVVLTGALAGQLAGPAAGRLAALAAALVPALAVRGAIATVDPWAALFVVAALLAAERARGGPHASLAAVAAGAFAGCAFASKYPAVLVALGFATTTLADRPGWAVASRRLALAAAGAVAGAAAAMPALVTRPVEVLAAIERQAVIYAHLRSPSFASQAFLRAEWDLPFPAPELGAPFLAAAAAGFVAMLRDRALGSGPLAASAGARRRLAPTAWGWLVFAAALVVVYARAPFQPFRNLLPLVPLACASFAVGVVHLQQWLAARCGLPPRRVGAAAVAALALLFAPSLGAYAAERARLVDSRVEAVDWLAARVQRGQGVLVLREMAFLPAELARLPGRPVVRRWDVAADALGRTRPRWVVGGWLERRGELPVDVAALDWLRRDYVLRAAFGSDLTPGDPQHTWRGSRQRVYVLERRD